MQRKLNTKGTVTWPNSIYLIKRLTAKQY